MNKKMRPLIMILSLFALCTLAWSSDSLTYVTVFDNALYLFDDDALQATSLDGQSWVEISAENPHYQTLKQNVLETYPPSPCLVQRPKTCYRTLKTERRLELSQDGGATWLQSWQLPPRGAVGYPAILETDRSHQVFVPMGEGGIYVGSPETTWRTTFITSSPPAAPARLSLLQQVEQFFQRQAAWIAVLLFLIIMAKRTLRPRSKWPAQAEDSIEGMGGFSAENQDLIALIKKGYDDSDIAQIYGLTVAEVAQRKQDLLKKL